MERWGPAGRLGLAADVTSAASEVTHWGRPRRVGSGSLWTPSLGTRPWTIPLHIGVGSTNVVMELSGVSESEIVPPCQFCVTLSPTTQFPWDCSVARWEVRGPLLCCPVLLAPVRYPRFCTVGVNLELQGSAGVMTESGTTGVPDLQGGELQNIPSPKLALFSASSSQSRASVTLGTLHVLLGLLALWCQWSPWRSS